MMYTYARKSSRASSSVQTDSLICGLKCHTNVIPTDVADFKKSDCLLCHLQHETQGLREIQGNGSLSDWLGRICAANSGVTWMTTHTQLDSTIIWRVK